MMCVAIDECIIRDTSDMDECIIRDTCEVQVHAHGGIEAQAAQGLQRSMPIHAHRGVRNAGVAGLCVPLSRAASSLRGERCVISWERAWAAAHVGSSAFGKLHVPLGMGNNIIVGVGPPRCETLMRPQRRVLSTGGLTPPKHRGRRSSSRSRSSSSSRSGDGQPW